MLGTRTPRIHHLAQRVAALLLLLAAPAALAFPSEIPTGTTKLVADKVVPGIVVFAAPDGVIYAIDPDGEMVRSWTSPIPDTSYSHAKPLLNGNMLVRLRTPADAPWAIVELNPAGEIVWAYSTSDYRIHHDHERLPNGNTLLLCSRQISVPSISDKPLQDDCLIEVNPAGEIVWEWQTADHFDDFGFSDEVKANIFEFGGDWGHANAIDVISEFNPHTDPRFKSGNVVVSYRHLNAIAVVDRPSGQIVHWFDNVTVGQHNAQMIPGYLPGGGDILVFDNGYSDPILNPGPAARNGSPTRPFSRVLEFDPLAPEVPIWEYTAAMSGFSNWWFFAHFISSAQRLPNGSTLITEGPNGRIFEVTPDGEIVWEYVSPFFATVRGNSSNQIFRAYKIPCTPAGCTPVE
jgi:hypothetical protein